MDQDYKKFYNLVMEYSAEHHRDDLPWRKNRTPYRVLVSEFMLQQTQSNRVISYFNNWMKAFPSFKALASASQGDVLRHWKGLGYNSRALRLHRLAKTVSVEYQGRLPKDTKTLLLLSGIGPYTAGAIRAFAFNLWSPIIETNIRRIYIHHFFNDKSNVSDKEILALIDQQGPVENPREWYEALMDYGSILPKLEKHNPNIKSKHYARQSKFKGSDREIRGKILGYLLQKKSMNFVEIYGNLGNETKRYEKIIANLRDEGFIKVQKKGISLLS